MVRKVSNDRCEEYILMAPCGNTTTVRRGRLAKVVFEIGVAVLVGAPQTQKERGKWEQIHEREEEDSSK